MGDSDNPKLPACLRAFSAAVIVVLVIGGGLFLVPDLVRPRWPWKLAPFNARFLGSFYLAEMVAMIALLVWNRWSPARLILSTALAFTVVVAVFSFFHLGQFDFGRKSPWVWFVLYIGSALVSAWFLWRAGGAPPVASAVSGPAWRGYFRTEAALFWIYGLGLILLPATFTAFWPWPVDIFHAQVYSAIFITAGVGNLLMARQAPREELVALGAAQLAFGALAVLGMVVTDAAVMRVDWSRPGTWLWIGLVALIGLAGTVKLGAAAAR
jgi:hypothetical protein